jgi:hypothetical protein
LRLSLVFAVGFGLGCGKSDQDYRREIQVIPPSVQRPMKAPSSDEGEGQMSSPISSGSAGSAAPDEPRAGAPSDPPTGGMPGTMTMAPNTPPAMRTFDAGTDPMRNDVKAGHVCARVAQIQCAGEAYCCDNPGRDVAACEAKMTEACAKDGHVDDITLNTKAGFNAERAADALAQFEEMASKCDTTVADFGADPDGLMSMVQGTVAAGGKCSPPVTGGDAAAAGALASCQNAATTACLPSSALTWTCAPRGVAGAKCFTDLNCQNGFYCPNPDLQINMTNCLARKELGGSCAQDNECVSLTCIAGTCAAPTTQSAYCLAM